MKTQKLLVRLMNGPLTVKKKLTATMKKCRNEENKKTIEIVNRTYLNNQTNHFN